MASVCIVFFFFSSRRRHTRCLSDWSSDVCSSDLNIDGGPPIHPPGSLIKVSSDPTVYLIDLDNRKRPLANSNVLAQLYNQSTDARTSTNFSTWVVKIGRASCRERV